ncbi:hypothetical protein CHARACLAT_033390 [Characodon lateralis]|uniref:Uncharacterized protein n=1 Tax=Characodon lateralis TaxID=208331 RepID=A0ABU7F1F0_9TELE|nr:hypothetical protein [Characodon lateralis]
MTTTRRTTRRRATSKPESRTSIKPTTGSDLSNLKDLKTIIAVAVGFILLVTVVAAVIGWRKFKGNKTWMNKNTEQNLIPAGIPSLGGSSQNMVS